MAPASVPGPGPGRARVSGSGDWRALGACRDEDPDLFFPITSQGPSARQVAKAKAVCGRCRVQRECLHFAVESRQDEGVWGGTTEEERKLMRRAQSRARRQIARDGPPASQARGRAVTLASPGINRRCSSRWR